MPSAEIVSGFVRHQYIGSTTTAIADQQPTLFMTVNGTPCGSAYIIQDYGTSKRTIFPRLQGNDIYLTSMGQVFGTALPDVNPLHIVVYIGIVVD